MLGLLLHLASRVAKKTSRPFGESAKVVSLETPKLRSIVLPIHVVESAIRRRKLARSDQGLQAPKHVLGVGFCDDLKLPVLGDIHEEIRESKLREWMEV
jgi:hypothetical protein